jgi:N-acetylglucosamine-6-phosphate deacetylase
MQSLAIVSGTCITPYHRIDDSLVVARDGVIEYVGPRADGDVPPGAEVIDATGQYVCPGFIDMQVNGGKGASVVDGDAEALDTLTAYHMQHGTTAMAPTLVSSSLEKMLSVLKLIQSFQNRSAPRAAKVIGAHLEGPYLGTERRGAHSLERIREAEEAEWRQLLERHEDAISLVTAAPEVPGVLPFARALGRAGIPVSMGHSDATYDEVVQGVEAGFSLVTHLYADTSTITRTGDLTRTLGIIEAAWLFDSLTVTVIADDVHLPAILVKMIAEQKGADRTVLISDAMRAAGMPDGEYLLGDRADENTICVENGRAQTLGGTSLAGSTVAMDTCLHTAAVKAGLPLQDAVMMATLTPARMLGVDHALGSLSPGKQADIVVTDPDFTVQHTIIDGRVTYRHRAEDAAGASAKPAPAAPE